MLIFDVSKSVHLDFNFVSHITDRGSVPMAKRSRAYVYDCCGATMTTPQSAFEPARDP